MEKPRRVSPPLEASDRVIQSPCIFCALHGKALLAYKYGS